MGTWNANLRKIYGAINVKNGIKKDKPGSKYTRKKDQPVSKNGIKLRGWKMGRKKSNSLYDSFSKSELEDNSVFSFFSISDISWKIVWHSPKKRESCSNATLKRLKRLLNCTNFAASDFQSDRCL
jgi:hypothetical protein